MFSYFWIRTSVSWPITFLRPHTTHHPKPLRAIPAGLVKVRCGGPGSPPAPYDCVRESESRWAWERDERGGQRMESSGCNPFPLCWTRGACVYSYPPPLPSMSPTYSTVNRFQKTSMILFHAGSVLQDVEYWFKGDLGERCRRSDMTSQWFRFLLESFIVVFSLNRSAFELGLVLISRQMPASTSSIFVGLCRYNATLIYCTYFSS